MLNSISIKNFRCFDNFRIDGFKNINLIGGLNNSGKTALLETLLLSVYPSPKTISLLRQFRNENNELIEKATEKIWNNFFYNQEKNNTIQIVSKNTDQQISTLEIHTTKDIETFLKNITSNTINAKEFSNLLNSKFSDTLSLNLKGNTQQQDFDYFLLPNKEEKNIGTMGNYPKGFVSPPFLHAALRLDDSQLSNLYSLAKENKKVQQLNEMLHLLDNTIIGSEIDAPGGEPVIKILLENDQSFPLAMFGDAIRKVTELMLILLNTSNGIFFIDEIENGIHFTKHKDLWNKLFQVIDKNDIQIFATSHSAEMIRAFNEVAYEHYPSQAMYFEMSRSPKTQQIIVNSMDMEMLNYQILTHKTYRGE
ncbi:MAG: AAA family ATPase [Chitinophagales bacterium]|nr:AAA family ATPase [Chitinophagales bacterium]